MIGRSQKAAALVLTLLIAWAGLVVFSPIHKHELGSPTKCSLNNLDALQADGPTLVCPLPVLSFAGLHDTIDGDERSSEVEQSKLPARAPPVLFS